MCRKGIEVKQKTNLWHAVCGLYMVSVMWFTIGCMETRTDVLANIKGTPLPSFNILLSDSVHSFNTAKVLPSGKMIVFYFAPDCPYSKKQMVDLVKHMNELKNIPILAITPYPLQDMKRFYESFGLSQYANIVTGTDSADAFGKYYNISGFPFTGIYQDRKLLQAFQGTFKYTLLLDIVQQ